MEHNNRQGTNASAVLSSAEYLANPAVSYPADLKCPECGQDFSHFKRPAIPLAMHLSSHGKRLDPNTLPSRVNKLHQKSYYSRRKNLAAQKRAYRLRKKEEAAEINVGAASFRAPVEREPVPQEAPQPTTTLRFCPCCGVDLTKVQASLATANLSNQIASRLERLAGR